MHRFIISRLLAAIALLILLPALVSVVIAAPAAQEATVVEMQDNVFVPETLTVTAGTTITWQNTGQNPHTATADDGSWDTGTVNSGGSASMTFNTPGTIPYYCRFHGAPGGVNMAGTIVVEAAQPTPEPTPAPQPSPAPVTMPDTGVSGTSAITLGLIAICMLLVGIGVRRGMQRRAGVR